MRGAHGQTRPLAQVDAPTAEPVPPAPPRCTSESRRPAAGAAARSGRGGGGGGWWGGGNGPPMPGPPGPRAASLEGASDVGAPGRWGRCRPGHRASSRCPRPAATPRRGKKCSSGRSWSQSRTGRSASVCRCPVGRFLFKKHRYTLRGESAGGMQLLGNMGAAAAGGPGGGAGGAPAASSGTRPAARSGRYTARPGMAFQPGRPA